MSLDAHRVVPHLWQGSFPRPPGVLPPNGPVLDTLAAVHAVAAAGFQRWVRCAKELPHDFALDDVAYPHEHLRRTLEHADLAAAEVVGALRKGHRVLVTCNAGLNRSGLVVGLVLVRFYGLSGEEAAARVSLARGPKALGNETFRMQLLRQPRR